MISLAFGALLIGALMAAYQLQRSAEKLPDEPKSTLQAAALSSLFIGVSALAEILLNQGGADIQTLQRMLSNLAYYAALPLIASALLVAARNDHWTRPAWGRWLIGLFALFELLRRMEYGELYTQIVAVTVSGVMLLGALLIKQKLIQGIALLAAINMAMALVLFGPANLLPTFSNPVVYPVLLAAALPLTATALKHQVSNSQKKA
ncbi:hypothetical protein [Amphritea balenae]|uniref:Uncharacterized protein n=1 Tax=Amphritea balenae TaxID=452629 RepID=A0A3P1SJC3_9GAMM|nr:hypothetical protein [Amphritea balenae]RRC96969.1 hypothetical protein EHS89_19725 [Amphritea balenae]GGK85231.1 hypothetical protein GCM10007941_39680 [Amphritea balenae]